MIQALAFALGVIGLGLSSAYILVRLAVPAERVCARWDRAARSRHSSRFS